MRTLSGQVSIRLNFYRQDTNAPQPLTGVLHVYTGTSKHTESLQGTHTMQIDGIPDKYVGKPLQLDLQVRDFELVPSPVPRISDDEPLAIAVRPMHVNYGCADAVFTVRILGLEAADSGPRPAMKSVGVRVRLSSKTAHPVAVTAFQVSILQTNQVPAFDPIVVAHEVELPASQSKDTTLDVEMPKDQYLFLQNGRELTVAAKCQNPEEPSDAGELVESDPWSMPPKPPKDGPVAPMPPKPPKDGPVAVQPVEADPVLAHIRSGLVFPIGNCREARLDPPSRFAERWRVRVVCVCANGKATNEDEISYADADRYPSLSVIKARLEELGKSCVH